jgi:two-component system, cell cycle sensor histidine kinase and response regulator CckA
MTLRIKTSLLLALIITLTLSVMGILYLRFLESSLKNSIFAGLESVSYAAAEAVSSFLKSAYREAQAVALSLPVDELERQDTRVIEGRLKSMGQVFPQFENGMFILDSSANLWADFPTFPQTRGQNLAHREYFQRTIEQKQGVISVPYRSLRTGEPVVTFVALLRGSREQILGVLGCSIKLLSPNALGGIRNTRIGQTGYVYVFDRSRLMILHPQDERTLKWDVPPGANKLLDAAIDGFEGVGETVNSRGVPMLTSFRQIPGTDWILGAQQEQAEAYAPLREARNRIIYGIIAAISISALFGFLSVQMITAPLRQLRNAALRYGNLVDQSKTSAQQMKDELHSGLKSINSGDEIGDLTTAFVDMVDTLDNTLHSLSASARDWRRTFDSVPDAIYILDGDNHIVRINRAAAALLKVTPQEAIGQQCFRLMHQTERPPDYCPHVKTMATGSPAHYELRDPVSNRLYDILTTPLKDDLDQIIGTVHLTRDITEKEELSKQLRQAQKMEAIGTLAGGIAHDFNNILGAVMGYTELTLRGLSVDSREHRYLVEAFNAANRAKELVKQILTFTRQREQERKPIEMGLVVKEALKLLRASLPTTIDIRHSINSTGVILSDPTQIHQIVMNLCTNALHAMRDKGGILEVTLAELTVDNAKAVQLGLEPGPYLELAVHDTGHGMAPEVVERIFDPYFTTKGSGEGTGLGLAVVHGIVKNSAGAIQVFSELGRGSRFHIYLPRVDLPGDKPEKSPGDELPCGAERVLFVDDEQALATIAGTMLGQLGYDVTVMTDSVAALDRFQSQPGHFDLMITDQTMPGMTGAELARQALLIRSNLPIILYSGFSEVLSLEKIKAMGVREFLMKPLAMEELARAVRRVLDDSLTGAN